MSSEKTINHTWVVLDDPVFCHSCQRPIPLNHPAAKNDNVVHYHCALCVELSGLRVFGEQPDPPQINYMPGRMFRERMRAIFGNERSDDSS